MPDSTADRLTAADVMTARPRTCSPFSSVVEASLLFQDLDCGAVPVVDGGRPVGILTDRDVALAVANNPDLGRKPVSDFMSKDVISVAPDASLAEVAARFADNAMRRLLVVDADGLLQGIVAWSDLAPHVTDQSFGRVVSETLEQP